MSVVIVGGHDRMVGQYKKICKGHNCKAKIFTQMPAKLGRQIGTPDLIILFTNTVSRQWRKRKSAALTWYGAIPAAGVR